MIWFIDKDNIIHFLNKDKSILGHEIISDKISIEKYLSYVHPDDTSFDLNTVNKDNFQDYYNFQNEMNKILSDNTDFDMFEDESRE